MPQLCRQSTGVAKVTGGRRRRRQAKVRSPLLVPTPKSPPPTSENSATFTPDRTSPSIRATSLQELVAEPFSRKGTSRSLHQCHYDSRVAACCSAGGERFSLRNIDGQESQFQKKRRAKNTSAQVTMGRQEGVSMRSEVLSFGKFFTLWRTVSETFWFDLSSRERLHAARFLGMESHGQFVCGLSDGWLLVSWRVTASSGCSFGFTHFSPWLWSGKHCSCYTRHVDGRERSFVSAHSQALLSGHSSPVTGRPPRDLLPIPFNPVSEVWEPISSNEESTRLREVPASSELNDW